jgi:hypothetical protein
VTDLSHEPEAPRIALIRQTGLFEETVQCSGASVGVGAATGREGQRRLGQVDESGISRVPPSAGARSSSHWVPSVAPEWR